MIRSLLRKKLPASRLALTIGLGGSLLALTGAQAQEPTIDSVAPNDSGSNGSVERVIVTGSNIPTAEEVGASPVDTIDQATRDRTGGEDVLTVLSRSNPAIAGGGGNLGSSNASISAGSTYGGSAVTVHGLPTLVLLNGRRLTDASAAAAGGGTFTDVNLFPSALVKRIEVLKDGASAIYGTEAVGGVINVILDNGFTGFDFQARYGFAEKGDIQDNRFSGLVGLGDDKTNIVIGAEYVEQDPVFNRQRDWAGPSFGTTSYAGAVQLRTAGAPTQRYILAPGLTTPNAGVAPGSIPLPLTANAGPAGFPAGTYIPQTTDQIINGFDLSRATGITLDQNRLNVYAAFNRELIGKHLVAFGDILYANVYSQSYLNAQPVSTATGVVIPAGAPFNPFAGTVNGLAGSGVAVANRFTSNPRIFRNDTNFYRVVAGVKGEIIPNYNYEIAFNGSQSALTFKNENLVRADGLNTAIAGGYDAAGNAVAGGQFSSFDGGATVQPALDFFSRNNPGAALNGIFGTNIRNITTRQYGIDGTIQAFPFKLPAGMFGLAVGGQWRNEKLRLQDSPEVFLGSTPVNDINRSRDVTSGFAEGRIPLVSPDMKVPGVYRLEIDGAGRYEAFSDVRNNPLVPKAQVTYQPIKDITLRGTYSQSFNAPTIYDLNGPVSQGFSNSVDLGAGAEQAQVFGGSNPNTSPSSADTYTAGIVISPSKVEGLTLNLDFFHVEQKNLIGVIDSGAILNSVNAVGAASPFASQVALNNFPGRVGATPVTAPGQLVGNLDNVYVVNNTTNFGGARIGGVDFGVHYLHDFGKFGAINLGIDGTYFLQYKVQTAESGNFYDVIGYYTGQATLVQPYHLTPTVEYKYGGFTASAIGNYIPASRDAHQLFIDPTPGFGGTNPDKANSVLAATGDRTALQKIRDYYTIDLLFQYEFGLAKPEPEAPVPAPKDGKDRGKNVAYNDGKDAGKQVATSQEMVKSMSATKLLDGLRLRFGINNVTNARPPLIVNSPDSTNTDAAIYDPYQRYYYFIISKRF